MEYRTLGKAGFKISVIGFGCGNVGGLLVRGELKEIIDAVARAVELGINYFDTAPQYGDGRSETNLGIALKEVGEEVCIGTKVSLSESDMENIEQAITESVNSSLKRLGKERIDLVQLHNRIDLGSRKEGRWIGFVELEAVTRAFHSLKAEGKVGFCGITGIGETTALLQAVGSGEFDTVQICYNLLNPSAGNYTTEDFSFQDYRRLIDRASDAQMGVLAVRVLAGGALSGTSERHPLAKQLVIPVASSHDFNGDVELSKLYQFLVDEGYTRSLTEAAVRFVISKAEISTALIGISSRKQVEQAVGFADRGPLPINALDLLRDVRTI